MILVAAMKPRHAAALALVGWYLMFPPVNFREGKVLQLAPLKYWELVRSFDTATQCNDYRDSDIREVAKLGPMDNQGAATVDKAMKWPSGTSKKNRSIGLDRASASSCIASDDPRLKEK